MSTMGFSKLAFLPVLLAYGCSAPPPYVVVKVSDPEPRVASDAVAIAYGLGDTGDDLELHDIPLEGRDFPVSFALVANREKTTRLWVYAYDGGDVAIARGATEVVFTSGTVGTAEVELTAVCEADPADGTRCVLEDGNPGICLGGACAASSCGDGYVDDAADEVCDDGSHNGSGEDFCVADCSAVQLCGDGLTNGTEACDDGVANRNGWALTEQCNSECTGSAPFCGDGFHDESYEVCDDGNRADEDACLSTCVPNVCGDTYVRPGFEQCDDGNPDNGDGCDVNCTISACGNGIKAGGEECDDGNTVVEICPYGDTSCTVCNAQCREGPGLTTICGDGNIDPFNEECDDGNTDDCVGACSRDCSVLVFGCGDGVVCAPEVCDEGSGNGDDWTLTEHCNADCSGPAPYCGDGDPDTPDESCDDAGANSNDWASAEHCNADCTGPAPFCGDGTEDADEICDEGAENGTRSTTQEYCTPDCSGTQLCGNAIIEGSETCDDTGDDCSAECSSTLPHHWTVQAPPAAGCFAEDEGAPFSIVVYDFFDHIIESAEYTVGIASVPSGATLDADGVVWVSNEGAYQVTLDVTSPQHSQSTITPQVAVVHFDSTPPDIVISYPLRGAMLLEGGSGEHIISITGSVIDTTSNITSLVVNGEDQSASGSSPSEAIATEQTSRWGMTIIEVTATDECSNSSSAAQAYLRSGQYYASETTPNPGAEIQAAIVAQLNQPVLDDANRNDVDDIATILWLGVRDIDLNALFGPVLIVEPDADTDEQVDQTCHTCIVPDDDCFPDGYKVTKTGSLIWSTPSVDYFYAISGGAHLALSIGNLSLPINIHGWKNEACTMDSDASVSGSIEANYVLADVALAITSSGGSPSLTICPTCIQTSFNGLWLDVDFGLIDFMEDDFDTMINAIADLFQNAIADALDAEIRIEALSSGEGFLDGFVAISDLTVPPPLSITLSTTSRLDTLTPAGPEGTGYLYLAHWAQVFPSARGPTISPASRGAIRNDGLAPEFNPSTYKIGIGLKDDMINQILWAAWYGGAFELPIAELASNAGMEGVDGAMSFELPPVLVASADGSTIEVGIGDAYFAATVDLAQYLGGGETGTVNVTVYLSVVFAGTVDLGPATNELYFTFTPDPAVHVEIVAIDDPAYRGLIVDLFTALLRDQFPRLLDDLVGSLPIPYFDLSGVGGLPPETTLQLTNGFAERVAQPFSVLTGDLQ